MNADRNLLFGIWLGNIGFRVAAVPISQPGAEDSE
jgi:hypothetical protein